MTIKRVFAFSKPTIVAKKLAFLLIPLLMLGLSGCITAPFFSQQFNSRFDAVPFTFWTFNKTNSVTVECAKASAHGGPLYGDGSYQAVKTVWPNTAGSRDSFNSIVYNASTTLNIPSSCWRNYSYSDGTQWITVLRVKQGGSDSAVYTFDKVGLECMGKWNGRAASWTGWLSHRCDKRYTNTGSSIKTVFLKAR